MKGKVKKAGIIQGEDGKNYSYMRSKFPDLRIGQNINFEADQDRWVTKILTGHAVKKKKDPISAATKEKKVTKAKDPFTSLNQFLNQLPYDFVPIEPDLSLKSSIPHHQGQPKRLSGEILLELEALTPLLVGNYRYAGKAFKDPKRILGLQPKGEQAVLEPLLDDQGRVLIPGSSLTGMLRASMSALLSAPMERVTERYYSYRIGEGIHPAIVKRINGQLHCLVLKGAKICFVQEAAYHNLNKPKAGTLLQKKYPVNIQEDIFKSRLFPGRSTDLDHYLYDYCGGIDGEGLLSQAFNGKRTYRYVLVERQAVQEAQSMEIPPEVYAHYQRTQEELADQEYGHISSRHPNLPNDIDQLSRAIRQQKTLRPNQLIYIEMRQGRIVSMGHHYHYRQAYRDTVLNQNGQKRTELIPYYEWNQAGKPIITDAVRALFGYVADEVSKDDDDNRLAGRLAFNFAVEQVDQVDGFSRFLEQGRAIQLKILGSPKPSAVECYIDQNHRPPNRLNTYGDLPNEPGGKLRGRKFYPHQDNIGLDHFKFSGDDSNRELATIARFISPKGTRFRCKLRFIQLEDWELGAVLAALDPESFLKHLPNNIDFQAPNGKGPLFAHKLGYAQPLGLGSVHIRIHELRVLQNKNTFWQNAEQSPYLDAFCQRLQPMLNKPKGRRLLKKWLHIHQYRGTKKRSYPQIKGKIFQWHSQQRRQHQKALKTLRN